MKQIGHSLKGFTSKSLTLGKTGIAALLLLFMLLMGLFYLFTTDVLKSAILEQEQADMARIQTSARGMVTNCFNHIAVLTRDWAQTGTFSAHEQQREDAELHIIEREIARVYDLDLIIATDAAGKPVHQGASDLSIWHTDALRQLNEAVEEITGNDGASFSEIGVSLISEKDSASNVGFACLGGEVYFLSSYPLANPSGSAYNGSLILGVTADHDHMCQGVCKCDYYFQLDAESARQLGAATLQTIQAEGIVTEVDYQKKSSSAYMLLTDLFSEPSIVLTIQKISGISGDVWPTAAFLLCQFGALFLILILILYFILEKTVLKPIRSLCPAGSSLSESVDGLLLSVKRGETEALNARNAFNVFSQLVNSASDEMILFDSNGKIEFINAAVSKNMGFTPETLVGENISALVTPQQREFLHKIMALVLEKTAWHGELIFKNDSGACLISKATIAPIIADNGSFDRFVLIKRNLDEVHQYKKQINHIAHHDHLTGLPNRTYFYKKISEAIEEAAVKKTKVAVYYIDIDRFKYINDTLGHGIGDKLIHLVAMRFISHFSARFFIARMGGDEFALLYTGITDIAEVEKAANGILLMLSRPFLIENEECILSASVGSSVYPDTSLEIEEIIKNADEAMYNAKKLGRNQYCAFSEKIHNDIIQRVSLENNLRMAVANGCMDFVPYFQPKVDSKTRRIIGSEALIRWITPDGIISPDDF
ncbi:MAG: diguanylate cyclase, partial [Clostridiales bacterium]|nr:diguanylate cyclase [Clostridiales bacterium]